MITNSSRELGTELEQLRGRWALRQRDSDQPVITKRRYESLFNNQFFLSGFEILSGWSNLMQFLDKGHQHYDWVVLYRCICATLNGGKIIVKG